MPSPNISAMSISKIPPSMITECSLEKNLRFAANSERQQKTWYGDNERPPIVHIRALLERCGNRIIDIWRTGSIWFLQPFPRLFTVWHTVCTWRWIDRWRVTGRTVIIIIGVVTCANSSVQHILIPWWEKDEWIRFDWWGGYFFCCSKSLRVVIISRMLTELVMDCM